LDPQEVFLRLRILLLGGHSTISPTVLAQQLKHYDVVNIVAAGTLVIRRPTTHAKLRADLRRRLPFETEVIICKGSDLISIASADRFADVPVRPDIVRFLSVFAKRPRRPPSTPISFTSELCSKVPIAG
jgi:hypothetical protein